MRFLSLRITPCRLGGVVLSAVLLVTAGCGESGPGVSESPKTPAGPTESVADKRPKEAQDGKAPRGPRGQKTGAASVKGTAPAGTD
jgi:hypothetical protein